MRYVVVGGGIAGTTAAGELRRLDPRSSVTLIGAEAEPLYSRVLLPHYVKGKIARERCYLRTRAWYEEYGIDWVAGTRAVSLDSDRRRVATSDGREFVYDGLLVATSGAARTFEGPPEHLLSLRTISDADRLMAALHALNILPPEERRAGVVGGSFIAIEYLNILAERRVPTDLFLMEETFFGGALDADSFALLRDRAEADGIRIHPSTSASAVLGDTRVEGLRATGAEYPLALLALGIGLAFELGWVRAAGIATGRGIHTNASLETTLPGIYAAGDVAEFEDAFAGRRVMVGNWASAEAQGRIAARAMAGQPTKFELLTGYATQVCGIPVAFVGDTDRQAADEIVRRGSRDAGGVTQFFLRDGRVVGATIVNRAGERAAATQLIRKRTCVSPARLAEAAAPIP